MKFVLLVATGAVVAMAQHPEAVREGGQLFVRNCSACHGDTGKGGRGPDLTTGDWKHGGSIDDLVRNITKGIAGTQMPPIPMPDAEARLIAGYLLSLTETQSEKPTGDEVKGRGLFFGAAKCDSCHMFAGRGGVLGQDLTQVRGRLKVSGLVAKMAAPIPMVEAGGVRGVAKGEDTFTLQLMDTQQKWHLLNKRGLTQPIRKVEVAHPGVAASDRNDIAAFLLKAPTTYDATEEWKPAADLNVTYARLKNAAAEPQNWLTYWGDFAGRHYSGLKQVTPANAPQLKSTWTYQLGANTVETTPLVVDGLMFVTGPLNNASALDAKTGRPLWKYTRQLPKVASHCTVMTNRGFAMLGDRLYMATLDTHLVALDAKSGNVIWDIEVDDYKKGYSITHAPLAIDGKIIVGVTSGECALTGWLDAYDAKTGKKLWRTHSTPQVGDPNRKTWNPEKSADFGGSPTWTTGTYDVDTDTIYWQTGNPGPDYDGTVRAGDNLYSCSVLALDAQTGKMKWWFQFTPHDVHDWDANETPLLIDGVVKGQKRKLLVTAQRNGFYYVLDRLTGEFLAGREFAKQTWAKGLDDKGRPIVLPNTRPTPQGNYVCPDAAGTANWGSPSFDPSTKFFIVSVREACAIYTSMTKSPVPGEGFTGGGVEVDPKVGTPGSVRALDATTGVRKWDFPLYAGSSATGVLATAGGVVFASSYDGNLVALDAKTGKYLWHYYTGANIITSPIAYAVNGKQYVAIASQSAIFVFGL
jgi:PQQ-dependent dehydrogenase (methanol/ethanol family)